MKRFVHHFWPKLLITLAIALGLYALIYWIRVPCLFKYLTGLSCPSCGLTRAWLAIFKGQVEQAFRTHPMFWSIPLLYVYFLAEGKLFGKRGDRVVLGLIVGGFGVVMLCRLLVPAWRV